MKTFKWIVMPFMIIGCQHPSDKASDDRLVLAVVEKPGHHELKRLTSCQAKFGNDASTATERKGSRCVKRLFPAAIVEAAKANRKADEKNAGSKSVSEMKFKSLYESLPPAERCPEGMTPELNRFVSSITCASTWKQDFNPCPQQPAQQAKGLFRFGSRDGPEFCLVDFPCKEEFDLLFFGMQDGVEIDVNRSCIKCASGKFDKELTNQVSTNSALRKRVKCVEGEVCAICRLEGFNETPH